VGLEKCEGRVKVENFKANKYFWRTFCGQNWTLNLRSSENELSVKVDIKESALGQPKITRMLRLTWIIDFKVDRKWLCL